jgi:hypothetical protein
MNDMAFIEFVLYATFSLIVYSADRESAGFSLRLPTFGIVRPCCLVPRCQPFGETSCLLLQDRIVIVTSYSLVSEEFPVFHVCCRRAGVSQVSGNVSGPASSGQNMGS